MKSTAVGRISEARVHHGQLAWAVAAAVKEHLSDAERLDIYVALGAGDDDAALGHLLRVAVRERIALTADAVAGLYTWVDACADADHEIRTLLALVETLQEPAHSIAVTPPRYLPVRRPYLRRR